MDTAIKAALDLTNVLGNPPPAAPFAKLGEGHFKVFWAPGKTNLADYCTKHHPQKHHLSSLPPPIQINLYTIV
jgi:hypothetical protein